MSVATRVNGVNIEAVGALVEKIRNDPSKAQTNWKASVQWKGAFKSEVKVRNFDLVQSDEPPALGGDNTAANPVEQLLGALGNCLAVGYAANATIEGIEIRDLKIDLEGDLDLHTFLGLNPEGNAGYSAIRVKVQLDADGPREKIDAIHRRVTATSPVGHTLSRAVPLSIQLS